MELGCKDNASNEGSYTEVAAVAGTDRGRARLSLIPKTHSSSSIFKAWASDIPMGKQPLN
jgi:hypothetical protein